MLSCLAWWYAASCHGVHRQPQLAYQPLHCAAGYPYAFSVHLFPDLVCTVHLPVGMPDPLNLGHQMPVLLGAIASDLRVASACGMQAVTRWGNLQEFADRLDPEGVAVAVDEIDQDLSRRSSSAWAKNALASLRISLARRSSLTSRFSAFMWARSSVLSPEGKLAQDDPQFSQFLFLKQLVLVSNDWHGLSAGLPRRSSTPVKVVFKNHIKHVA